MCRLFEIWCGILIIKKFRKITKKHNYKSIHEKNGIQKERENYQNSEISIDFCFFSSIGKEEGKYFGIDVFLISLHHLRKNKQASGREKDMNDLKWLDKYTEK